MKKKPLKSIFASIVCFIYAFFPLYADPAENVTETVIENGLTVFCLEDFSSPLVRIELCVKAGYSSQSNQTAGFFQLFANLIEKSSSGSLSFSQVLVDSDSTRFIIRTSPSALKKTIQNLSEAVFEPFFSDELLKAELALIKRQVLQNAQDPVNLINSSIDSRVFSDEPWRHDSGVYPALFASFSQDEVRTILLKLQEDFFTPQNSAVFVSGNIQASETLQFIKDSFGSFYVTGKTYPRSLKTSVPLKKYVIHDKEFSSELTQVVLQYPGLEASEAYLASLVYNNNPSSFKNTILSVPYLEIPGDEYIDISPATKSGCTRLICQTLMQASSKQNPLFQTEYFIDAVKQGFSSYDSMEIDSALRRGVFNARGRISSSSDFMDLLSGFWASLPYESHFLQEKLSQSQLKSLSSESSLSRTSGLFIEQSESFRNLSFPEISDELLESTPFVFVIMNTKVFNKYKKDFASHGYEEISSRNGSWYTNELYKNTEALKEIQKKQKNQKSHSAEESFFQKNSSAITKTTLSNGIPVVIKHNPNTTGVSLSISISGGSLSSAENPGFEDVMVNLLTVNMMRQISARQKSGLIDFDFNIYSETFLDYSHIVIECSSGDLLPVLSACSTALVFDDILPSDADRVVMSRQTRKRLYNGSMENQLYAAAVKELCSSVSGAGSSAGSVAVQNPLAKIYEASRDILEDTTYEKILQNYPSLLDSSRFSLMVSGNLLCSDQDFFNQAEKTFSGLLAHSSANRFTEKKVSSSAQGFPYGKSRRIKLTHTFLTDIPAKDAGPMPAVLVPTKSFSDPVMYCLDVARDENLDSELVNAVLFYLQDKLSDDINSRTGLSGAKVSVVKTNRNLPFAAIIFSSVDKTSACDELYREVYDLAVYELSNTITVSHAVQEIKDLYVENLYGNAMKNSVSASLMEESLFETAGKDPAFWLEKYKKITSCEAEGFLYTLKKYFAPEDLFRLYSADSKR